MINRTKFKLSWSINSPYQHWKNCIKKTGENVCSDILMKSWKKTIAKIWPEALNKLHLKNELNEVRWLMTIIFPTERIVERIMHWEGTGKYIILYTISVSLETNLTWLSRLVVYRITFSEIKWHYFLLLRLLRSLQIWWQHLLRIFYDFQVQVVNCNAW